MVNKAASAPPLMYKNANSLISTDCTAVVFSLMLTVPEELKDGEVRSMVMEEVMVKVGDAPLVA